MLENLLVSHVESHRTIDQVLQASPPQLPGPWIELGDRGRQDAYSSSSERTLIPNTNIRLLDSEPIYSSFRTDESEFSHLVIKLVGFGHGIQFSGATNN